MKEYHGKRVVDEVSIEVNQGEIVGLLGPNGAGKTTTFYMVVGHSEAEFREGFHGGRGHDEHPHAHEGAERHRISSSGTIGLQETDGGGEHTCPEGADAAKSRA